MTKNISLEELMESKKLPYERFHAKTKIRTLNTQAISSTGKDNTMWNKIYFKAYARMKEISLPKAQKLSAGLSDLLIRRTSKRVFSGNPLTKQKLSNLLYYSAGLKNNTENPSENLRFYPSAGARYPLEIYVYIANSKSIKKGLYHYYVKNNSLEKLMTLKSLNYSHYFNQKWVKDAAAIIFISAAFKRNVTKYGSRGYRHVLMEAGHLGQNIYLCATALHLSCCAIGGYIDDRVNELIDIDELEETIIYILAIG